MSASVPPDINSSRKANIQQHHHHMRVLDLSVRSIVAAAPPDPGAPMTARSARSQDLSARSIGGVSRPFEDLSARSIGTPRVSRAPFEDLSARSIGTPGVSARSIGTPNRRLSRRGEDLSARSIGGVLFTTNSPRTFRWNPYDALSPVTFTTASMNSIDSNDSFSQSRTTCGSAGGGGAPTTIESTFAVSDSQLPSASSLPSMPSLPTGITGAAAGGGGEHSGHLGHGSGRQRGHHHSSHSSTSTTASSIVDVIRLLRQEGRDSVVMHRLQSTSKAFILTLAGYLSSHPELVLDLCYQDKGVIVTQVVTMVDHLVADGIFSIILPELKELAFHPSGYVAVTRLYTVSQGDHREQIHRFCIDHFMSLTVHEFGCFLIHKFLVCMEEDAIMVEAVGKCIQEGDHLQILAFTKRGSHALESLCGTAAALWVVRAVMLPEMISLLGGDDYGHHVLLRAVRYVKSMPKLKSEYTPIMDRIPELVKASKFAEEIVRTLTHRRRGDARKSSSALAAALGGAAGGGGVGEGSESGSLASSSHHHHHHHTRSISNAETMSTSLSTSASPLSLELNGPDCVHPVVVSPLVVEGDPQGSPIEECHRTRLRPVAVMSPIAPEHRLSHSGTPDGPPHDNLTS